MISKKSYLGFKDPLDSAVNGTVFFNSYDAAAYVHTPVAG
jgi:hypothetical protein